MTVNESNKIMTMAMFTSNSEPSYTEIDGYWLSPNKAKYVVIHRMAVGTEFRGGGVGIAKCMIKEFEKI